MVGQNHEDHIQGIVGEERIVHLSEDGLYVPYPFLSASIPEIRETSGVDVVGIDFAGAADPAG
jgi:hypothetical protein